MFSFIVVAFTVGAICFNRIRSGKLLDRSGPGSCRTGKCCNSKFSCNAEYWCLLSSSSDQHEQKVATAWWKTWLAWSCGNHQETLKIPAGPAGEDVFCKKRDSLQERIHIMTLAHAQHWSTFNTKANYFDSVTNLRWLSRGIFTIELPVINNISHKIGYFWTCTWTQIAHPTGFIDIKWVWNKLLSFFCLWQMKSMQQL